MNFKVQIILILVFYKKVVSTNNNNFAVRLNRLPKIPPNLSLYRYEGNFYPSYASNVLQEVNSKPRQRFTRYLNPVHLSHQIYHDDADNANHHQEALSNKNGVGTDDATGSEYQVAMKVQPLHQVISSGKPQDTSAATAAIAEEESGKSHQDRRQLKIDIMSPEKRQSQLRNNQNSFYNQKNNELQLKSVPANNINTDVSRHYHDIFLNYKSPQELVFGHVLSWPELAQKRLEKRDNNHFKGQVIWADKTGGYGEHYWDLAQGAL